VLVSLALHPLLQFFSGLLDPAAVLRAYRSSVQCLDLSAFRELLVSSRLEQAGGSLDYLNAMRLALFKQRSGALDQLLAARARKTTMVG
jgi:hypothetical protein